MLFLFNQTFQLKIIANKPKSRQKDSVEILLKNRLCNRQKIFIQSSVTTLYNLIYITVLNENTNHSPRALQFLPQLDHLPLDQQERWNIVVELHLCDSLLRTPLNQVMRFWQLQAVICNNLTVSLNIKKKRLFFMHKQLQLCKASQAQIIYLNQLNQNLRSSLAKILAN